MAGLLFTIAIPVTLQLLAISVAHGSSRPPLKYTKIKRNPDWLFTVHALLCVSPKGPNGNKRSRLFFPLDPRKVGHD